MGGNSRTLIILCITPTINQYEQTVSTLRFGTNAKKIENKVEFIFYLIFLKFFAKDSS